MSAFSLILIDLRIIKHNENFNDDALYVVSYILREPRFNFKGT